MNLLKCILTANDCYKTKQTITPKGVMVHSTGANNPMLRRYVQPLAGDADYDELMALLGKNPNGNSWNRSGTNSCVHAFVGKLADGSVAAVQTLPWNHRGWHAGTGTSGRSANNTHISFEICEDGLTDARYFNAVYQEAVELTAYLCKECGLDPLADGVVICHSEGYKRGVASGHADVEHWFPKHGKTMYDFRADVAAAMTDGGDDEEDQEDMTRDDVIKIIQEYEAEKDKLAVSAWAKPSWDKAVAKGITDGTAPRGTASREAVITMLDRIGLFDD